MNRLALALQSAGLALVGGVAITFSLRFGLVVIGLEMLGSGIAIERTR